jgi:RNA polymerase sigma-70 factor (ECF subfamily)
MGMSEQPTDSAATRRLLEGVRLGNPQAFVRLFAQHRALLLRLVELRLDSRLRGRVDPSDIVQETYLEAYRRLDHYLEKPGLPFRQWLRQIAYDHTRKASRQHRTTQQRTVDREIPLQELSSLRLAEQLLAGGSTPSQRLDRQELAGRVRQALDQLPEADRELLILRHFEGLSNQEAAGLLGLEPGTVSKRHGRALLRLHKLLLEGGMTESQP